MQEWRDIELFRDVAEEYGVDEPTVEDAAMAVTPRRPEFRTWAKSCDCDVQQFIRPGRW